VAGWGLGPKLRGWLLRNPQAVERMGEEAWQDAQDPTVASELGRIRVRLEDAVAEVRRAVGVAEGTFSAVASPLIQVLVRFYHPWEDPEAGAHEATLWQQWCEGLDGLAELAGDEQAAPRYWLDLLEQASRLLRVALPPRSIDHVTVSTADRTRMDGLRLCVVMGASEGMEDGGADLPGLSGEERQSLSERGLLGLQHGAFRGLLDRRLTAYFGLTRWREKLVVTRPKRHGAGQELPAVAWFDGLRRAGAPTVTAPGAIVPRAGGVRSVAQLEAGLLAWASGHVSGSEAGEWAALYESVREQRDLSLAGFMRLAGAAGLFFGPLEGAAETSTVRPEHSVTLTLSDRDLSDYLICPFKYLAGRELGLKALAERGSSADDWVGLLRKAGYGLRLSGVRASLKAGESAELIAGPQVVRAAGDMRLAGGHREEHVRELAGGSLVRAVESLARWFEAGGGEAARLTGDRGVLAMPDALTTPKGNRLILTTRSFWAEEIEAGNRRGVVFLEFRNDPAASIKLSKLTVERALEEGVRIAVTGAVARAGDAGSLGLVGRLVVPLRFKPRAEPSREKAAKKAPEVGNGQLGGWMVDEFAMAILQRDPDANAFLKAKLTNAGKLNGSTMGTPWETIEAIQEKVVALATELADAILSKRRHPLPVKQGSKLPCGHCDFGSVCRFDIRVGGTRSPGPDLVIPEEVDKVSTPKVWKQKKAAGKGKSL
jgi:hypothetical protein